MNQSNFVLQVKLNYYSFWYSMQIKPEACFNIDVVQPDPFFPPNQYCMNFVRHAGSPPLRCENGRNYCM
jgi:hypothetical protein